MDGLDVVCALDGSAVVGELEGLAFDSSYGAAIVGEFDRVAIILGASDGAAICALDGADEMGEMEGSIVIEASDGGSMVGDTDGLDVVIAPD